MQCSTLFSVFNGAKVIGICNGVRSLADFFKKNNLVTYGT